MRKIISIALILCMTLSVFSAQVFAEETESKGSKDVVLNVYNWGEYISNGTNGSLDVNKAFTEATGIKVNYTTYDSNESLYAKLAGGGADYDIIIPSDYMISKLAKEGMLAELNFDNIPNFKYVDKRFQDPDYDPGSKHSVPYTWGLVGLFYNKEHVEKPTSWDALWNEDYAGKILMFDNPRDAFAISQISLGYSLNTENEDEWHDAANKLKEQKPLIQAYVMDQIFDKMESGEAWLAPYYSGDAGVLVEENDHIGFVFPEEGTNYFVDGMCIPATSSHKAEAEAYINFLCDPKISGANMDYIGYSTPIPEAKKYLSEDVVNNEIFYPSEETMKKTEVFVNLPQETSNLLDSLWAEVKMGGPGNSLTLVAIILVFLAIYIYIIVYKKRKRKRELM